MPVNWSRFDPASAEKCAPTRLHGLSKGDRAILGCGYICFTRIYLNGCKIHCSCCALILGIELNKDGFASLCRRDGVGWLPDFGAPIGFGHAASSVQID